MATEAEWTIGKLLKWTTDYFQQYGADSPRLDAEVLLAEAVKCERIQLYTSFDETPDPTTPTASEQRKFEVTENNDVVLEVIDPQSQEVVRSVPSEEQLDLRDAIRSDLDNIDLDSI